MPTEAPSGQPQVLLVGEAPLAWRSSLSSVHTQFCRSQVANDVYAAVASLLKASAGQPTAGQTGLPAAVLVLTSFLRGDEFRFFDLLARRWPMLPAAALYEGSSQDRKLDVCRRKGVDVISSCEVQDWLSKHLGAASAATEPSGHPSGPAGLPQTPPVSPAIASEPSNGASIRTSSIQSTASPQEVVPPSAQAGAPQPPQDSADLAIHDLPDESFVDLPDELVAHLPDHLDEDLPEQAPDPEEMSDADMERELPGLEDEDELPPPAIEESDDPDAEHRHLTPWSSAPRPQRQRPVRKPPQTRQVSSESPADVGIDPPDGHDGDGQQPAPPSQPNRPPVNNSALPDYGLLTPEELRALLQDPEDNGDSQGARP